MIHILRWHASWLFLFAIAGGPARADETPTGLSEQEQQQLIARFEALLKAVPAPQATVPTAVRDHSRRGDALFFLGRFPEAVREYEAMVQIDPAQDASHWRLGIALFFADEPERAVAQFEKYHSFDNVDRENGIWRYLSQYKAAGGEKAKKELIRYEKDDREPFPAVYKLFDNSLSPEEALAAIPADLSAEERDKRLFYTELYIGMHMVVKKETVQARKYLARAVSRKWPRNAGFGPNYMWHVGRVQLEELTEKDAQPKPAR